MKNNVQKSVEIINSFLQTLAYKCMKGYVRYSKLELEIIILNMLEVYNYVKKEKEREK